MSTYNVTTYSDLQSKVAAAVSGDTIYIGASITCTAQIKLSGSGITLTAKSGVTPVLDFSALSSINSGTTGIGIYVTGSSNTISGLIIQKAGDNGMKITGASNTVSKCIFRYNGDTGLQISGSSASNNSITYCDSYRNCDTATAGENADGFACKLSAGTGNSFTGCRSFQNSDDGWDSYDMNNDVTYTDCITWHNGDSTITAYAGNGNGFKLGSEGATGKRTMTRCIAWDTKYSGKKGFDQNNGIGVTTLTNCLSFDNVIGYQLDDATSLSMTNCREFNCTSSDSLPSGVSVTMITDTTKQASIRSKVTTACNQILSNCENNIITGAITLDIWS